MGHEEGTVGEEPNHTTARKPSPLSIIQYSVVVGNSESVDV
jgi:hypothetical protein